MNLTNLIEFEKDEYTIEGISYDNSEYVKYVQCPQCGDTIEIDRKEDTSYR